MASTPLVVIALEEFAIPAILGMRDETDVSSSLIQASPQLLSGPAKDGQASAYASSPVWLSLATIAAAAARPASRTGSRWWGARDTGGRRCGWTLAHPDLHHRLALRTRRDHRAHPDPGWTSLTRNLQPISLGRPGCAQPRQLHRNLHQPDSQPSGPQHPVISLIMATLTAGFALWLALAVSRGGRIGRRLFEIRFLGFAIPAVVLGMAALFLYLYMPFLIARDDLDHHHRVHDRSTFRRVTHDPDGPAPARQGLEGWDASPVRRRCRAAPGELLPVAPAVSSMRPRASADSLGELPIAPPLSSSDYRTVVARVCCGT